MSKKLLLQSSIYSVGKVFSLIAGLISYPILTKNLSISEYGVVALLTVTIGLMSSFMKFGLQHSVIRFYHELKYEEFISNLLYLTLITLSFSSLMLYLVGTVSGQFFSQFIFRNDVLLIIISAALMQSIQSYVFNLFVAKEKSKTVTGLRIVYRFISLITMLIAILYIQASAYSFLISLLIADIIFTLLILLWTYKAGYLKSINKKHTNKGTFKSMLLFGIPMLGYEISNMIHAFIDRFMIENFLGSSYLGLYSAPYNMANMISDILIGGVATAVIPLYLNTWKTQGKQATEKLLANTNRIFLIIVPAVIAGLYAVSEPLLGILATDEYKSVAYIMPIASIGSVIFGLSVIYAAGLQINKSTSKLFRYVLESTIINATLNYILIPEYGLIAAALNTVVSYVWMALRFYIEGNKTVKVEFDLYLLLRSITYAGIMSLVINHIETNTDSTDLILRSLAGVAIYTLLLFLFEKQLKKEAFTIFRNWKKSKKNTSQLPNPPPD